MLLAVCLFFGLLGVEPQPGPPADTPAADILTIPITPPASSHNPQAALLNLINMERSKAGVKPLNWDAKLAEAALDHAEIMSQEGRLSHQFEGEPDLLHRLTRRAVRLDSASENVVYDVSAEGAHEAFVNSAPHRTNMLNPAYDGVGIAVVNVHGVLYVVEDFAHRILDLSDDVAAHRIGERFSGLRKQFGLPPLELVGDSRLQGLVAEMANHETLDSHAPLSLPGVRFAASYATTSPDEIPADVARLASIRGVGTCAVGVEFARTPRYPSGLFWVSIVLFDPNAAYARR